VVYGTTGNGAGNVVTNTGDMDGDETPEEERALTRRETCDARDRGAAQRAAGEGRGMPARRGARDRRRRGRLGRGFTKRKLSNQTD